MSPACSLRPAGYFRVSIARSSSFVPCAAQPLQYSAQKLSVPSGNPVVKKLRPMKSLRCLLPVSAFILLTLVAHAADAEFPGLKAIMKESDWQTAKLDRLNSAELKLVNQAFAQYLQGSAVQTHTPAVSPTPPAATAPEQKRSLWSRFGLGAAAVAQEAEKEPLIMQVKVTAWQGTNGFVLDNGQVWAGIDPIREELVGREIGIKEGRFGSFLLVLDGESTTVRLRRVK